MSVLINNNKFTKVYFGGDNISKIYKGKDLVFQLSSDGGGDDGQYTDDDYFEITTSKDISLNNLICRIESVNGNSVMSGALRSDVTLKANTATVISASSFWATDFSKNKLGLFINGNSNDNAQYITKVKVLKGMNKYEYAYNMFTKCLGLKEIDLSYYNTSKVTNMGSMFDDCNALTSLNLSKFDTSSVIKMSNMFNSCSSLTSLDVSKFDTSSVTDMGSMFSYCTNLKNIIFGPSWGKNTASLGWDFRFVNSNNNYQFTDETWNSMLNMYDRASNDLSSMNVMYFKSSSNFPDGWVEKMTARGYTISKS